jgi:DNA polymerase-4
MGIDYLCEEIGEKLRKKRLLCGTVAITIKDENLNVIQRQKPQTPPTDITKEISATAFNILSDVWSDGKPIRMITVAAANLIRRENASEQISFFDSKININRKKSEKRDIAIDKIRQKYGDASIVNGAIIDSDIGIYHKKQRD